MFSQGEPWENRRGNHRPEGAKANYRNVDSFALTGRCHTPHENLGRCPELVASGLSGCLLRHTFYPQVVPTSELLSGDAFIANGLHPFMGWEARIK